MRRREYYWSIFHTKENNQLDGLRTDQVEAVYAAIPKAMCKEWLIWRDGFEGWKSFEDFPQLMMSLRKVDANTLEAPPRPVILNNLNEIESERGKKSSSKSSAILEESKSGDSSVVDLAPEDQTPEDLAFENSSSLVLMAEGGSEDRNNFRFEKVVDVRILVGDKIFENKTVNISLKGMQLKSPLPQGLPRYINVEIVLKDNVIPVVCTEVRDHVIGVSMRLKIEVNDYASRLLAVLLAG